MKIKNILLFLSKQYAAIGGQAVIEGVMMRSPHAFVVAVRKPDGTIRLRRDQWFGLSARFNIFKKPFLRGVIVLIETMANGVVSLNYSVSVSENKDLDVKNKGVNLATFLSIAVSFVFGIGLFVLLPHGLTALIEKLSHSTWDLNSLSFHAVDGAIKAFIFILYIYLISFLPDVKRVFQYHGAEHKSISTFEAGLPLTVENAKPFPTFHPRCGTTFVFFLMFVSIFLFAIIFAIVPIDQHLPPLVRHGMALVLKIVLSFPIAGISYELIKYVGTCSQTWWGKMMTYPGALLQKLTTMEPDDAQLEVALASIKAVLFLEERYDLKTATDKKITLEEKDFASLSEIETSNMQLVDFLES